MEVSVGDVVMPGDTIKDITTISKKETIILGPGLRREADTVFAYKAGVLKKTEPAVYYVDSYQKRYIPNRGENVVGIVTQRSSDIFKVDIGASEQASLSYLAFEGATKKNRPDIQVGDLVFAKLLVASKDMEPELVCVDSHGKEKKLGALSSEGMLFTCSLSLVRKILNRNSLLFKTLSRSQAFEVAVGMNGRVWVKARTIQETIAVATAILAAEYAPPNGIKKLCLDIEKTLLLTQCGLKVMGTIEITFPFGGQSGKLLKWRVRMDTMVSAGRVLFLYQNVIPGTEDSKGPEKKFRATRLGRVTKILAKEGDVVQPGQVVMTLEGCRHPTVMKDLCAECGVDLRVERIGKENESTKISQASVPMVHSVPELKVCPELAKKIGKEDEQRLLNDRKLALLVDLDQTIVHTTNDNIPSNIKDVYHYQLYGPNSPWYHTRLRPNTKHFLSEMSRLYELHICTFGARNYAHTVAALLDKDGTLFSHRILSRDECFDPASKTANLKALFPCGDDLVCIIDDREDVWQGCGNLVQVKPYHFFRHTGDIHAPPGLEKSDVSVLPELQNTNELCIDDNVSETDKNGASVLSDEGNAIDNNQRKEIEETIEDKENEHEFIEKNDKSAKDNTKSNIDLNLDFNNENKDENKATEESKENLTLSESVQDIKAVNKNPDENNIIDEDDDDYLLYLEDILRRIHTEFYATIEKEGGRKSLRDIIPRVRAQVLKGVYLTFSGLIPTHQKLHQSRAYKVARAFGAEVAQDLSDKTTHLVAIRPGTAKANAAKKNRNIKIVNPDWLWTCAERWEHVDERLFPLTTKARASRIPPPHCSSPERIEEPEKNIENSFADSINPLMSFTPEEIEIMDKEVEEDMDDQELDAPVLDTEDIDDEQECDKKYCYKDSDSDDSINHDRSNTNEPIRKKKKLSNESSDDDSLSGKDDTLNNDDDDPVTRFRRGECLPDDLDLGDNSQDSIDDLEIMDNEDEREWNEMGAALEREFLSE